MITDDVLATYAHFGGDLDGWQRVVATSDSSMGPALYRLADLLQRAGLVTREPCDPSFEARIRTEVEQEAASPAVAARIWALAGQDLRGADV